MNDKLRIIIEFNDSEGYSINDSVSSVINYHIKYSLMISGGI